MPRTCGSLLPPPQPSRSTQPPTWGRWRAGSRCWRRWVCGGWGENVAGSDSGQACGGVGREEASGHLASALLPCCNTPQRCSSPRLQELAGRMASDEAQFRRRPRNLVGACAAPARPAACITCPAFTPPHNTQTRMHHAPPGLIAAWCCLLRRFPAGGSLQGRCPAGVGGRGAQQVDGHAAARRRRPGHRGHRRRGVRPVQVQVRLLWLLARCSPVLF